MSNVTIKLEQLNALAPLKIVKADFVKAKFIEIYEALWGTGTGEAVYERESIYFNRIMAESADLQRSTKFSIFTAFIDLAVCGLSLERGLNPLIYLLYRNYNMGKGPDGKDVWERRACITISAYGELVLRQRAGQIRFADNPIVVYEEDEFSFADKNGSKTVSYECHYPHVSNHIIAAFMRIIRNDGSADYAVMLEEDWVRLAGFSTRQNKGKINELYNSNNGGIDTGFLKAKLIKHAFKTYPKLRLGRNTNLQTQEEEPEEDYYGVGNGQPAEQQPEQPQAFGPEPDTSAGVQVQDEGDGAF